MRWTFVALGLFTLTACQADQQLLVFKPGASNAQIVAAYDQCAIASLKEIPQTMTTQTTGGFYAPGYLQCSTIGSMTTCNRVGQFSTPARTRSYDVNEELRERYIKRCLAAKGYQAYEAPACVGAAQIAKAKADRAAGKAPSCGRG